MDKATKVMLTGIIGGGTTVFHQTDRVGDLLAKYAPNAIFKSLPTDGIVPNV